MTIQNHPLPLQRYLVRVGHNQITVVCRTAAEAIASAKAQLRREFPRFWDVISGLADNRFQVQKLES